MDIEQLAIKAYTLAYKQPPYLNDERLKTTRNRIKELIANPNLNWPDKPPFSSIKEVVEQEKYIENQVKKRMPGLK